MKKMGQAKLAQMGQFYVAVYTGNADGGEPTPEDVLLDGGGAQAERGGRVPQVQQGSLRVSPVSVHQYPFHDSTRGTVSHGTPRPRHARA